MEELYQTLGYAKSVELDRKFDTLWQMLNLSSTRKSTQVGGVVIEGLTRDFIKEFLPFGFSIKSGLVFDRESEKKISPQIDGIIYSGVPLVEYTDAVLVEKEQVRAIIEIKSWIHTTNIFGDKGEDSRDSKSGLASAFESRSSFLPSGGKYVLFAFELHSAYSDDEVINRLREVCDFNAVIARKLGRVESGKGNRKYTYNFDNSVSWLIEWLRNLS